MPDYYIGLISGTSMDGIDAVLVAFGDRSISVKAANSHAYPAGLRHELITMTRQPDSCTADILGKLDHWTGECFRDAALGLLDAAGVDAADVVAIGSHGQTIRHRPDGDRPYSWQIGSPSIIAKGTGIDCVADFRGADIALGGQGAPLMPPFHDWLFRSAGIARCVLNIGGIANITVLPATGGDITGFDTGPGNTLLDAWSRARRNLPYDDDGQWSASGSCDEALLARMLADPYFGKAPPKSTGFEYFNDAWLQSQLTGAHDDADVQATLCELSAASIAGAIESHAPGTTEILVCGGGVHNGDMLARLGARLPGTSITSSAVRGLDPDWVEACGFAWLAMRRCKGQTGNAPAVTGASRATLLGAIHAAE